MASATPALKKLNIGCAGFKKEGYINVDWQSIVTPDVSHNLNVFPYPFADNSIDHIEAFHILEHLDRPFDVMREFHRIMKPGATLHIKVPHFSRAMTHPEHFHGFDVTFPNYFNPRFVAIGYYGVNFKLTGMRLRWLAFFHILKDMGYGKISLMGLKVANTLVSAAANLSINFCSRIWCFWVGGFDEIEFHFTCTK
jgi:SAM-dependent methyltransferase